MILLMGFLAGSALAETFDERRLAVLEAFAKDGSEKFIRAECLFALGRSEEALVQVNKGLDALEPGNKINRWMHGGKFIDATTHTIP
jgi:hypothetical protein